MSRVTSQHYAILGVPVGATKEEIRRTFRELTRRYHPDKHTGDAAQEAARTYSAITEAYQALLSRDETPQASASAPPTPPRRRPWSGVLHVPWLVSIIGGEALTTAPDGRLYQIRVPSGVEHGSTLRLGDVAVLRIAVEHDDTSPWARRDDDLEAELRATWLEAWRGDVVEVDTPWGRSAVELPAATRDGDVVVVDGYGLRAPGRAAGSLRLRVRLVPPPPPAALDAEVGEQLQAALRAAYEERPGE